MVDEKKIVSKLRDTQKNLDKKKQLRSPVQKSSPLNSTISKIKEKKQKKYCESNLVFKLLQSS